MGTLGIDTLIWTFVVTTLANLVVKVGAEIIAEWVVNGGQYETASSTTASAMQSLDISSCATSHMSAVSDLMTQWQEGVLSSVQTMERVLLVCGQAI